MKNNERSHPIFSKIATAHMHLAMTAPGLGMLAHIQAVPLRDDNLKRIDTLANDRDPSYPFFITGVT